MQKVGWIFLASLALQLLSSSSRGPDTSRWQSIDCGREVLRLDDTLFTWAPNLDYTQTGTNELVRINTTRDEFNTLRAFPNNTKDNCYNVPTDTEMLRYIIRVGFYYGNYDGLSRPPTFDLFINNIKWTTINTSINNGEPVYEEIIYNYNKGSEFFKICLVHIQDGGIPIINSIETVGVAHVLYPKMETNATYSLVTRINFGGPEVRYDLETDEIYNRIWSKGAMPYANASGLPTNLAPTFENHPPRSVLADAIESNASDPITLTIDLPQQLTSQSAYIVLYITKQDDSINPNQTASVRIEIDSQDHGTVNTIGYGEATVVTKYPVMVSGPTINVTLSRVDESSLPPMIAAMEVFTKWDTDNSAAAAAAAEAEYSSIAYSLIIFFMLLLVA